MRALALCGKLSLSVELEEDKEVPVKVRQV